jgi:hypothetical protein
MAARSCWSGNPGYPPARKASWSSGAAPSARLLAACAAIVRIGKTASADDIAWLAAAMREALA